jgi:methionyl-tRNA formyltransferase
MIESIILLTSEPLSKQLVEIYKAINPSIASSTVYNSAQLALLPKDLLQRSRLISFVSTVIVPKEILPLIKYGAYNFHPAPPSRPGWGAINFSILQGDAYFGVTLHKMMEYVDVGPIIDLNIFPIPKGSDVTALSVIMHDSLSNLVHKTAKQLIENTGELDEMPFAWGNKKYAKKDYLVATLLDAHASKEEVDLKVRAFGHHDNVAELRVIKDGELYFLTSPQSDQQGAKGSGSSSHQWTFHGHQFQTRPHDSITS